MTDGILSHARPSRADAGALPPPKRLSLSLDGLWHNLEFRSILYQALVFVALVAVAAFMIGNAQDAMHRRGISTGFGFLTVEAGFAIGEALIAYDSSDTYLRAYGVVILNMLRVSAFAIVAATLLGLLVGIARLSRNWIAARLSSLDVELFRNTRQLLQIIFWYCYGRFEDVGVRSGRVGENDATAHRTGPTAGACSGAPIRARSSHRSPSPACIGHDRPG